MKYVVSLCANTLIYSINTPFVAGAKLTTIYFIQELNFEMLTLERVRAAFFSTALSFSLVHHKPKANALAHAFFFGSLFLFALAIEQKEKVNKNFSFL